MRLAGLAAVVLVLAGCLDDPTARHAVDGDRPSPAHLEVERFPVDLDHDHTDAALHTAHLGLERIGHLDTSGPAGPQGVYNLAMGERLLVASLASASGGGSLVPGMTLFVADVSDAEAPRALSSLVLPGGGVEAVAVTPDDRFAFVGTEFSGAVGIWAIDLADPAAPRPAGFTPLLLEGPHNLRYGEVGGRHLVFASVSHVATAASLATGEQDSSPLHDLRVDILEFDPAAPAMPMRTLASYTAAGGEGLPSDTPIVHDAVWQRHPLTGQDLLYVAHWDRGVRIVDVSDPEAPVEVGAYGDPEPTTFLTIHTVKPHPGLVGGRHYTVATAQCAYTPDAPCHVRVLDTTDPTQPVQVGTWTLPETVHGPAYTTEIFDLAGGVLVVPWGHGGVWALDLACAGCPAAPGILGYHFLGDVEPALAGNAPFANAALLRGGVAYVANVPSGIDVLRVPGVGQ